MNKVLILAATALLLTSCVQDEHITKTELPGNEPLSVEQIDAKALELLQQHEAFWWHMVDDQTVWSAAMQSDSIISVGYTLANIPNVDERIHELNLEEGAWRAKRSELMKHILRRTRELNPEMELSFADVIAFEEEELPVLDVRIWNKELITELRARTDVRYVDPMGYSMLPDENQGPQKSGSGCGINPDNNIPTSDYTTQAPSSAKVPWNYSFMNIPQAWARSQGDNITVGLIDTGVGSGQAKLGSQFTSGYSGSRYINKYGTYVSSWWCWGGCNPDGPNDQCGHGTQMAGLIAAPRSGPSSTGVAYKANLVSYRGTGDVIINGSSEKKGVSDALKALGNRSDVRIISMSIGDVFSNSRVRDAVRYAHGRGKLIFAAAGTSLSWTSWWGVIFPANMSETVAVTGIRDNVSSMQRCDNCHSGSQVDFVAVMQRASNTNRTSLTLSMSGNTPSRVGGSSAATATTAGIAALVWARTPSLSRTGVINRLKQAASFYPSRNSQFGWGLIDANQAVQ
ncbi:MAG: S8 family serine peptidase [Bacteroidia bacterium]